MSLLRATLPKSEGSAWWLPFEHGPYDDPEDRPPAERCLLGLSGSAGPPALPVIYNNVKRIVQTDDHIMIFNEMIHDARIVRMNASHLPGEIRRWLGDSIGWWEGQTLVIETTNFRKHSTFMVTGENLRVLERLRRLSSGEILYQFTVDDPAWVEPWSGEYVWRPTESQPYEYACHEANYSMSGILKGARMLEHEAQAAVGVGPDAAVID